MKSEFSAIWSSVIPICISSSRRPFQDGSLVSKGSSLRDGLADGGGGGGATWIEGAEVAAGAGGGGPLGTDDDRWPSKLPKIERPMPPLPFITGAGP